MLCLLPCENQMIVQRNEDGLIHVLLLCKHKLPNNKATREPPRTTHEDSHCADVTTEEDTTTLTEKHKTENRSTAQMSKYCAVQRRVPVRVTALSNSTAVAAFAFSPIKGVLQGSGEFCDGRRCPSISCGFHSFSS